jgi:radical SAM protein with 4Fe4S-binding SPASM domain
MPGTAGELRLPRGRTHHTAPESFEYLEEFRALLEKLRVSAWVLKLPTFEPPGSAIYSSPDIGRWATQMIRVIRKAQESGIDASGLPSAKFAGCEGVGMMLCVEPDGDVYPCPGGIRLRLGRFHQLPSIPSGPAYLHVAGRTLARLKSCRACEAGGFCAAACAADAERRSGSLYSRNPQICRFQRALVRSALVTAANSPPNTGGADGHSVLSACTV